MIACRFRTAARLACASLLVGGCVYVEPARIELAEDGEQSAEQILGTYFLLSTVLGPGSAAEPGAARWSEGLSPLATLYPPRAQLVTHALIAYHREHGSWPTDAAAIRAFIESSPANPRLPVGTLDGFQLSTLPDGACTYSTREDRQRGRYFTLTAAYRVTFPVPAGFFASATSPERPPPASGSTLSVDWTLSPPLSSDAAPRSSR